MKTLIWLIIPLSFLSGCIGIPRLTRPERPVRHYTRSWQETETVRPKVVKVNDDRVVVVEERSRTLIAGVERTEPPIPPRTLLMRVGMFIGGLSLVYAILALVLGPGVVVSIIVWKVRTARRLKRAVREIVRGVKKSELIHNDSEEGKRLHDSLKKEISEPTYQIISDVKSKL